MQRTQPKIFDNRKLKELLMVISFGAIVPGLWWITRGVRVLFLYIPRTSKKQLLTFDQVGLKTRVLLALPAWPQSVAILERYQEVRQPETKETKEASESFYISDIR